MTPIFKKLNYKNQTNILVLNAPASFDGELHHMAAWTQILKDAESLETIDFALVFATQQNLINATISLLFPKLEAMRYSGFVTQRAAQKNISATLTGILAGPFLVNMAWSLCGK